MENKNNRFPHQFFQSKKKTKAKKLKSQLKPSLFYTFYGKKNQMEGFKRKWYIHFVTVNFHFLVSTALQKLIAFFRFFCVFFLFRFRFPRSLQCLVSFLAPGCGFGVVVVFFFSVYHPIEKKGWKREKNNKL